MGSSDELRSQWITEALERTGRTQKGLADALIPLPSIA
jgi:hypothetical protein